MPTRFIDQSLLSELLCAAEQTPRLRKNFNFHTADDASCHRLLNALQPNSYVQPHCHLSVDKAETMLVLTGRMGVLIFNAEGEVIEQKVIAAGSDCLGIDIAPGVFHSLVALAPTVFFEAKAGPYIPVASHERATWAPAEGEAGADEYLAWMRSRFEV